MGYKMESSAGFPTQSSLADDFDDPFTFLESLEESPRELYPALA